MMVDNVASMVIESCLVQSLPTLLTATSIIKMDDRLISIIASEADGAQEERQLASQKLAALEKALQICGQHTGHQIPGVFLSVSLTYIDTRYVHPDLILTLHPQNLQDLMAMRTSPLFLSLSKFEMVTKIPPFLRKSLKLSRHQRKSLIMIPESLK